MKTIFPLILFFISIDLFAQDPEIIHISGTIINSENHDPLPFVHVVNISKRQGITSDEKGWFSLAVPKTDTLIFSSVGFKLARMIFKDSTETSYRNVLIKMIPETITLNNVEIRAYNLEEILNKAKKEEITMEKKTPEPLFEPKEKIEKPTVGIGVSPNGAALEGAITAFANLFNNEFKQRKKLKEILAKEELDRQYLEARLQLENNYKDIAIKITGLEKEEFDNFLRLYMPDIDFLINADDYDLALRIYQDYRDFRYKFKLEEVSLEELMENAKFRK